MNLFNNPRIRLSIIVALIALQVASVTFVPKLYSDDLFYLINIFNFTLGFLSLNWKQAVKNISFVTLPSVIFIALLLLIIAFINGKISEVLQTFEISFQLWGLVLLVMLPVFLFGFGLRLVILIILRMRLP